MKWNGQMHAYTLNITHVCICTPTLQKCHWIDKANLIRRCLSDLSRDTDIHIDIIVTPIIPKGLHFGGRCYLFRSFYTHTLWTLLWSSILNVHTIRLTLLHFALQWLRFTDDDDDDPMIRIVWNEVWIWL